MECVANADEALGEMFLEEKVPTTADLKVCFFNTQYVGEPSYQNSILSSPILVLKYHLFAITLHHKLTKAHAATISVSTHQSNTVKYN